MANKHQLSVSAFVRARSQGRSLADAAREAGSKGTRSDVLSKQGRAMEAQDGVLAQIDAAKRELAIESHSDWLRSVEVLAEIRDNAEAKDRDRLKAVDTFAKIGGHYAPKLMEHRVMTAMDLVEQVEKEDEDA